MTGIPEIAAPDRSTVTLPLVVFPEPPIWIGPERVRFATVVVVPLEVLPAETSAQGPRNLVTAPPNASTHTVVVAMSGVGTGTVGGIVRVTEPAAPGTARSVIEVDVRAVTVPQIVAAVDPAPGAPDVVLPEGGTPMVTVFPEPMLIPPVVLPPVCASALSGSSASTSNAATSAAFIRSPLFPSDPSPSTPMDKSAFSTPVDTPP
jgi:hypothetical protein